MEFQELLDDMEAFDKTPEGLDLDLRLDLSVIILRHLDGKKWTQAKLAAVLGMKESQLTRIVHSNANCTFETVGRIFHALGIKPELVVKRTDTAAEVGEEAFTTLDISPFNVGVTEVTNGTEETAYIVEETSPRSAPPRFARSDQFGISR